MQSRVYANLPPPFAWCAIPAGKVTLVTEKGWDANYIPEGKSQTFDVPAFAIAKYPVTNAQFAKFVEAKGYEEQKWWTDAGWQAKEQGIAWDSASSSMKPTGQPWTAPHYWTDANWNGGDYPVVGVSWYEAAAFCRWLSTASGEKILLPTEQQWQRAAQGNDDREYPWGNAWDGSRCNHSVGKDWQQNSTSPVTQYEGLGASPFGVTDLAGNVWEWCLTAYQTGSTTLDGTDVRVLRGGAWWDLSADNFRAASRYRYNPDHRRPFISFRCVRSG